MIINRRYLQIRHWDYWYRIYGIGEFDNTSAGCVEFSITNDSIGDDFFFHFDFINLPALEEMIVENEYMEKDHPDFPDFHRKCVELRNGDIEYFIGALYYKDYHPTIKECNQRLMESQTIMDVESPPLKPHYAVVFIRESRSFKPEILVDWVKRISDSLFKEHQTIYQIAVIPTTEQTQAAYESDGLFTDDQSTRPVDGPE